MAKKTDNFKGMAKEDLKKKVESIREEIRVIRFKGQGGKSKNVKETANLKKQVARALTAMNSK
ncbi:MAG: 50S ribosomal protein L29 [bacterium]